MEKEEIEKIQLEVGKELLRLYHDNWTDTPEKVYRALRLAIVISNEKGAEAQKKKDIDIFNNIEFGFTDGAMECPICKKVTKFWSYLDNPSICLRCKLIKSIEEGK